MTHLDERWCPRQDIDVAILHSEKLTDAGIGNKAYKLSVFFDSVGSGERVLSFGGRWSNHLYALAMLCQQHGVGCVGVVRGDQGDSDVLLQAMRRFGMQLYFVSRDEYRRRDDVNYCENLTRQLNCSVWLPEGGSTDSAVKGCHELGRLILQCGFEPTHVVLPVGTGATLAGIVNALSNVVQVTGCPVVRDDKVQRNIARWVGGNKRWTLSAPMLPGYGKVDLPLIRFVVDFYSTTQVILDPVYSGKALRHCLESGFLNSVEAGARIMFVHTGGVAGNYGYFERFRSLSTSSAEEFILAVRQSCRLQT